MGAVAGDNMPSKSFICYYAQDQLEFRLQELQSIAENYEIEYEIATKTEDKNVVNPFLQISVQNEDVARKILKRSILIRYMIEPWACGCTMEEISNKQDDIEKHAKNVFTSSSVTFRIDVEGFNKKMSMDTKMEWIDKLGNIIRFPGTVRMKEPDQILCLLLDFGSTEDKEKPCNYIYFGKWIGNGQRDLIHKYSLKTRYFIGNTSMDPQLSFLMANQGQVKKGSFVYDPFAGTGSILTCCAHFGAYTSGSDIDRTIIYGRGRSSRAGNHEWRARDEIIRTNYKQYGLLDHYVDVMVADVCRSPLRSIEMFDAIITDPPYGIREGGRKLTSNKDAKTETVKDSDVPLFPSSSLHQLSDIILDLIEFAALYLRPGGRLVYWLPVYAPTYTHDLVPQHPCFQVTANSEQKLTTQISRRLITMIKTIPHKDADISNISGRYPKKEWREAHNQFRSNYFKGKT